MASTENIGSEAGWKVYCHKIRNNFCKLQLCYNCHNIFLMVPYIWMIFGDYLILQKK
jgi:hypothetical protein